LESTHGLFREKPMDDSGNETMLEIWAKPDESFLSIRIDLTHHAHLVVLLFDE
jgi:hypothetical protein